MEGECRVVDEVMVVVVVIVVVGNKEPGDGVSV